ncbi:hypothetical protein [Methylococcus geothermalis]|uniref:Uncharacterized protein n=1 Tax=Methylococcus geothermalis TaxID=2681310 RepID=A0A858Q6F1_9GAMM|nr:hypothetical protein [Methylococcus geothermalis]QJD29401.1 hypothetical protein GNH96_05095 [Methylococcus geothermalis]
MPPPFPRPGLVGVPWTLNDRVAMWAQNAVGTTRWTPGLLSTVGVDLAF